MFLSAVSTQKQILSPRQTDFRLGFKNCFFRVETANITNIKLSGEAKHSNRSCYANLRLSSTIKTIDQTSIS